MVFFSCDGCGGSLKKNQVEKHRYSCYGTLCCIDCNKDFPGNEYVGHTKCISEIERYSGKGWKAPANFNKGEKKQEAWVDLVQSVVQNAGSTLKPATRNLLLAISKHDNVPRKKPKLINFVQNVTRRAFDLRTIEEVWDLLEVEWNKSKKPEEKPKVPEQSEPLPGTNGVVEQTIEAEIKKEKKKKKKQKELESEPVAEETELQEEQPKKKKKRKELETVADEIESQEDQPKKKKRNELETKTLADEIEPQEDLPKKKKRKDLEAEPVHEEIEPHEDQPKKKKRKELEVEPLAEEVELEDQPKKKKKSRRSDSKSS